MSVAQVLALDVGGTKLAAGVVDDRGTLSASRQIATPRTDDPDELLSAVVGLLEGARADAGPLAALGVGCGGPMDASGVSPLNIPAWRGFPLRERLAERLALDVAVDNDAKALALGEGWVGAAAGRRDFLAMVVSTGVGGGIVLDGRLLDGERGNAGHIGHVIVVPGGRRCACGARGCLEAEASGTGIAAATGRPSAEAPIEVRRRTGTLVGRAVASVANLLDLRLACLAGSVALGYGDVLLDAAREEVAASARIAHARGTEIRIGALGASGPLVGAGAVAWRALGRPVLG